VCVRVTAPVGVILDLAEEEADILPVFVWVVDVVPVFDMGGVAVIFIEPVFVTEAEDVLEDETLFVYVEDEEGVFVTRVDCVDVLDALTVILPETVAVPVLEEVILRVPLGEAVVVFEDEIEPVVVRVIPGENVGGADLDLEPLAVGVREDLIECVCELLAVELLLLLEERVCVVLADGDLEVVADAVKVLDTIALIVFRGVDVPVLEDLVDDVICAEAVELLLFDILRVFGADTTAVRVLILVGVFIRVGADVLLAVIVRVDVLECVELLDGKMPPSRSNLPWASVTRILESFIQGEDAMQPIDSNSVVQRIISTKIILQIFMCA
jgi:hypothetical protein